MNNKTQKTDTGAADTTTTTTPATGDTTTPTQTGTQPQTGADGGDKGGSLLQADPADKQQAAPAKFPDKWREELAGTDEKLLARLQRMQSPLDVLNWAVNAEKKLSSGAHKANATLPENATEEQVAEFRKANGIPEKADGYEIKTPDGFTFGDADKPLLDSFKTYAHANNMTPREVNLAANWYAGMQKEMQDQQHTADVQFNQTSEDALRQEWGGEYRSNIESMKGWMATWPEDVRNGLLSARDSKGQRITSNPAVLQFLVGLQKEINPAAVPLPSGTQNDLKSIASRKAELLNMVRDNPSDYYGKAPEREMTALIEEEMRLQNRGQAA